jgi:hypothetical protein
MYRPSSKIIIALCGFILGLNVLAIWLIDSRLPAAHATASRADTLSVILPTPERTPQTVEKCDPVVDDAQIKEQRTVIATLEAEVARLKSAPVDDGAAWRHKAQQLEHNLLEIQKVAQRVMEMPDQNWQEGKLLLAHALVKEKT